MLACSLALFRLNETEFVAPYDVVDSMDCDAFFDAADPAVQSQSRQVVYYSHQLADVSPGSDALVGLFAPLEGMATDSQVR